MFVEDPLLMSDFAEYALKQVEETSKNKTKKEQSEMAISCAGQIIEVRDFPTCFFLITIRNDDKYSIK